MDAETRRVVAAFEKEVRRLSREVETLRRGQRTPQLSHSSIDDGTLEFRETDTGQVLRIGITDGRVGLTTEGGEPSPAPSAPVVAAAPMGLMVSWDGQLSDPDLSLPVDFDHVSVHVSEASGFTPTAATFVGTIPRAGGLYPVVPLEVDTTYYVLLVPVGTGGVEGTPSAQASGVPEGVGGAPGPGSITETEIADDSISTPKLQALAVNAAKIAANAIEAGHITAGAVEASKLAATIVLSTRIVAGDPMAARVELDEHGLRGYNTDNEVVFAVDDSGNAVFTGTISGSEISGSRFTMGSGGVTGTIEASDGMVVQRVLSGSRQAQLFASPTSTEFSARQDTTDPSSPSAAMYTQETQVGLVIDSSRLPADQKPSITAVAFPDAAQMVLWSERNNTSAPRVAMSATSGEVSGRWVSASGALVQIRALPGWASISATPEESTTGQPAATAGYVFAFRRSPSDAPTLSLQSPLSVSGPGAGRRSIIHVEGANTNRAHTVINHAARVHYLQGELVNDSTDTTTDGRVEFANTHSLLAPRMRPVVGSLIAVPDGGTTTPAGGSTYVDFTVGQWERPTFRTPTSGLVRITINMAGVCGSTPSATFRVGFRIVQGSTTVLAGATSRSAITQARASGDTNPKQMSVTLAPIALTANTDYTLVPMWAISAAGADTWTNHNVAMSAAYENSITIEPVM